MTGIITGDQVLAEVHAAIAADDQAFAEAWVADVPIWVIARRHGLSVGRANRLARRLGLPPKRAVTRMRKAS